jgi:PAS domain S-box-containing protein
VSAAGAGALTPTGAAGTFTPTGASSSLRRRINRLLVIGLSLQLALVLLTMGTATVAAVDGLRAVAALGGESAAARLMAGMADQQSGLLMYADSADPASLVLYGEGQQETVSALAALRTATAGRAEAADEAGLEPGVRSWERWAESMRQRVESAGVPIVDPRTTTEGRRLFASFRAAELALVSELQATSASGLTVALASAGAMLAVIVGGSALVAILLRLCARRVVGQGLRPLGELAGAANEIAAEGRSSIPHVELANEVGELARALQGWQDAAAVRTILVEQAPVGICRIDAEGRFLTANVSYEAMLGYSRDELAGRPFWTFLHPDDAGRARDRHLGLMRGSISHYEMENRWRCKDGSTIWFSMVAASVMGVDGRPETLIGIMEDITDRKREAERAAWIQRELLPRERPRMDGYELAAACLPAEDVGGDFYDWVGPQDGHLDLTLADAMGKGVGAALVMATLRTALRTTSRELGPAARVSLVAESMSPGLMGDGLFVTLFHARLELGTGLLRYVDAGHGHCAVRRADGALVPMGERSPPLGMQAGGVFSEGRVELRPGDTLVAYTDGLVRMGQRTIGLEEATGALEGAGGAEEMVGRLVGAPVGERHDDVSVIVLWRRPTG